MLTSANPQDFIEHLLSIQGQSERIKVEHVSLSFRSLQSVCEMRTHPQGTEWSTNQGQGWEAQSLRELLFLFGEVCGRPVLQLSGSLSQTPGSTQLGDSESGAGPSLLFITPQMNLTQAKIRIDSLKG